MTNNALARMGLVFGITGLAVAACGGGDDNAGHVTPTPGLNSSGNPGSSSSSSGTASSSSSSSGAGDDASLPPPTADLVVGHGYNEIGPIKICFAQSTGAPPDETTPLPAVAPLPRGGAGVLPPGAVGVLPKLGVNLSQVHLLTYAIRASSLAGKGDVTCDQIAGGSATLGLQKGVDYFVLPPQPKGGYLDGRTYLIFVSRPLSETPDDAGTIGQLALYTQELDTTTPVDADKVGIQYVHGSRYIPASAPFVYRPTAVDAGTPGGDAGAEDPRKEFFAGSTLVPTLSPPTALVQVQPLEPLTTTGFGIRIPTSATTTADVLHETGGNTIPLLQWVALSDSANVQVETLPDGGSQSLYFEHGRSFTFMSWGDPTLGPNPLPPSDPAYALEALRRPHLTVIPNRPKTPALQ